MEIKSKTTKTYTIKGMEESDYWVLLDEYGARFMVFDDELAMNIKIDCPCEVFGKVVISRGGTYLVIERVEEFISEKYEPTEKRSPNWQDKGSVFDMVRY